MTPRQFPTTWPPRRRRPQVAGSKSIAIATMAGIDAVIPIERPLIGTAWSIGAVSLAANPHAIGAGPSWTGNYYLKLNGEIIDVFNFNAIASTAAVVKQYPVPFVVYDLDNMTFELTEFGHTEVNVDSVVLSWHMNAAYLD